MTDSLLPATAGIDLGGTATRIVICTNAGTKVVSDVTVATVDLGAGPVEQRVSRLAGLVSGLVAAPLSLMALGIGASGPVDAHTGIVHNTFTLPWFSDLPLTDWLGQALRVPVLIENDAVTAAVGEYRAGAGRGAGRMLMVTLGTGIGVALLDDGVPFRRGDGQHPEAGHIPISSNTQRCYCGLEGCWELVASRKALERRLQPFLRNEDALEDGLAFAAAAALGNPVLAAAFDDYGRDVGRGLATVHATYGPDIVVLGGSVAQYLPLFLRGLQESSQQLSTGLHETMRMTSAELGDRAGAVGAAIMAATTSRGSSPVASHHSASRRPD